MKNFPDQDQFNELEKRLQGYSEEPDELVWQNVDKVLRPRRTPLWIPWITGTGTVAAVILVALMWQPDNKRDNVKEPEAVTETQTADELKKKSNATGSELQGKIKSQATEKAAKNEIIDDKQTKVAGRHTDQHILPSTISSQRSKDNVYRGERNSGLTAGHVIAPVTIDKSDIANSSASDNGNVAVKDDSVQVISSKKESEPASEGKESVKDEKRIPKRGLSFYASLTPQLSFQRVIPAGNDGVVISDFYNESIISADRFGVAIEAGIQGFLNRHWEYYGGLSYYQQNQTLKYAYLTDRVSLESATDNGYIITPESEKATLQYAMRNWGATIGLMYNLQGKKLAHKLGAGISYQKGFNKQTSEKYNNSESSYLFYNVFYRNEVRLNAKWRVYVQPAFMHSFYTKQQIDAPFTLKPYRAGISFGIVYDF